ncbi:MAG: Aspartyl-tRNA(Asn) amidotransferase subunit [Labilithrix sp.]|nr:Aspartyl-tRNA(Asn) amidotransferase subunit [Labilithrix sp.]
MSSSPHAWEAVIGLEVHAQLLTRTKLFCPCPTSFGAPPNTHVCPTCLGMPGALPVLNAEAARMAVKAALALDCAVRPRSRFARKNYFYPDLPKGYQISQFDEPFSDHGHLDIAVGPEGQTKRARILRIHMEEDAGKNIHGLGDDSVVDLNRAGVPLVEIVGEPDLSSPHEAAEYLRTLREILVFIGINDGNLEEGSFRCDANVSIKRPDDTKLGTRVELKNINSFKFVERAIATEIERQKEILEGGGRIVQETRGWDEKTGTTTSLRSKEAAQDYRYFPEPDLPPVILDASFVDRARAELPELPRDKRARFVSELGLTPYVAQVLTQHPRIASFFEEAAITSQAPGHALAVANFVQSEVLRDVTTQGQAASIPVTARQVSDLQRLVLTGAISGKQAKELYAALKTRGPDATPEALVSELGMAQVSDPGAIEAICAEIIAANPKQAASLQAGKTALFGFFVGQVMKATKGSANPQLVNDTLKRLLGVP